MKQYITLLVSLSFMFFACKKENNNNQDEITSCYKKDAVAELAWLKKLVDDQSTNDLATMIIKSYKYNNTNGFLIDQCTKGADSIAIFYNCEGDTICTFGGIDGKNTCPDFATKAIEGEIIFKDSIMLSKLDTIFCGNTDPLTSLPWLKKIVTMQDMHHFGYEDRDYNNLIVKSFKYNNINGYLIDEYFAHIHQSSIFYNCSGDSVCLVGGVNVKNTCPDFASKAIEGKRIFVDTISPFKLTSKCEYSDPFTSLSWLADHLGSKTIIQKSKYYDIDGFLIAHCIDCADVGSTFYDCSGNPVCDFNPWFGSNCPDFDSKSVEGEIIYNESIKHKQDSTFYSSNDLLTSPYWIRQYYSPMTIVQKYTYNEKNGYLIYDWSINDTIKRFYDFSGKIICDFNGYFAGKCPDFGSKAIKGEVIFIDTTRMSPTLGGKK